MSTVFIYFDFFCKGLFFCFYNFLNYILEISREETEDGEYELISHMKLQKLIYFCQGYSLALFDKPLFPEPIEAWTHGPVCPDLYHRLKGYGASPITSVIDPKKIALDNKEKLLIKMVYNNYGQYSALGLRNITHEQDPWKHTPISTTIYHETMSKYFDSIINVNPSDIPPATEEDKNYWTKMLEEAEANGEIDLSRFCVPVGA